LSTNNQPTNKNISIDRRFRTEKTCCHCGTKLTEQNWPLNARKYKRNGNAKIWHICEYCFKERMANNQYKFHTGIVLKKRIKTGKCELCNKRIPEGQKLLWHHWDDSDASKGVWACNPCHWVAESVEKHLETVKKYLIWKEICESPRYKTLTFESGPINSEVIV
jgi:hypothetical protein